MDDGLAEGVGAYVHVIEGLDAAGTGGVGLCECGVCMCALFHPIPRFGLCECGVCMYVCFVPSHSTLRAACSKRHALTLLLRMHVHSSWCHISCCTLCCKFEQLIPGTGQHTG